MFNIQLHIVLELADAGDLSRMIKVIPQPQPRILLSFRFLFPSLDAFLFGCTFVDILFWQGYTAANLNLTSESYSISKNKNALSPKKQYGSTLFSCVLRWNTCTTGESCTEVRLSLPRSSPFPFFPFSFFPSHSSSFFSLFFFVIFHRLIAHHLTKPVIDCFSFLLFFFLKYFLLCLIWCSFFIFKKKRH